VKGEGSKRRGRKGNINPEVRLKPTQHLNTQPCATGCTNDIDDPDNGVNESTKNNTITRETFGKTHHNKPTVFDGSSVEVFYCRRNQSLSENILVTTVAFRMHYNEGEGFSNTIEIHIVPSLKTKKYILAANSLRYKTFLFVVLSFHSY